jgi:hypothetical protein
MRGVFNIFELDMKTPTPREEEAWVSICRTTREDRVRYVSQWQHQGRRRCSHFAFGSSGRRRGTEEGVGVKPEFYAVMSGRRKTSPPCFRSLREEEEGSKTVWALSPNICDEAGRRKLHRVVFKASGRRRKP